MSVLSCLYTGSKEEAREDLLSLYREQGYVILSFLYFANVMKGRLLEPAQHARQETYKQALCHADYVFPDGIALQLFYRRSAIGRRSKKALHNLNGTDFIPDFLRYLARSGARVHIALYDMFDETIGKPKEHVEHAKQCFWEQIGLPISFVFQAPYAKRFEEPFAFSAYQKEIQAASYEYKILLLCVGTPAQEMWAEEHRAFIEENGILCINAGGTIDYISGLEQRAPKRVVNARVLETVRRITTKPKKNLKKFLAMFGIVRYRGYLIQSWISDLWRRKKTL